MRHIDFYKNIVLAQGSGQAPSGVKTITENGVHDVAGFAQADVQVTQQGVDASYKTKYEGLRRVLMGSEYPITSDKDVVIDDDEITRLRDYACYDCNHLVKVVLKNVTSVPRYAFGSCSHLKHVDLPNATTVNSSAFDVCAILTHINLPKVEVIKDYAFAGVGAKKIMLPSCREMYGNIMANASTRVLDVLGGSDGKFDIRMSRSSLEKLIIRATNGVTPFNSSDFLKSTHIYVPDTLVEAYKTATNWSQYAEQIFPLSSYVEGVSS